MGMVWTQSGPAATRLSRRMMLAGGLGAFAAAALPRIGEAVPTTEADSTEQTREQAIQSLPLDELTPETRRKLMAVCERPTLFRLLPQQSICCDPTLHVFLIRNPEVVVSIWQLMEDAHMTADRQGPFLWKGSPEAPPGGGQILGRVEVLQFR